MTAHDRVDLGLEDIRRLPRLLPDPDRAVRVRARCQAALARRRRLADSAATRRRFVTRVLEPALVAGVCLIYLSAVIREALQIDRLR